MEFSGKRDIERDVYKWVEWHCDLDIWCEDGKDETVLYQICISNSIVYSLERAKQGSSWGEAHADWSAEETGW